MVGNSQRKAWEVGKLGTLGRRKQKNMARATSVCVLLVAVVLCALCVAENVAEDKVRIICLN